MTKNKILLYGNRLLMNEIKIKLLLPKDYTLTENIRIFTY